MTEDDAAAWDEIYAVEGRRAEYPDEFVIRFVNSHLINDDEPPGTKRVLDVGCGPGRHVAYLAREGFEAYGVDYSDMAVEMAEELFRRGGLDADVREEQITNLPFDDDYFNAVIDCASVQHNYRDEIADAIAEIARVLVPGGLFFWKARAREDSFYGKGIEAEPGTFVAPHEGVMVDDEEEAIKKPTHFFRLDELTDMLDAHFEETSVEYTERTYDDMTEKIAHYLVVARK